MNAIVEETSESETNLACVEEKEEPCALKTTTTLPGTVLSPGDYLVEMGIQRKVEPNTLLVALAMMGWGEVMLDQSMPNHSTIARTIPKKSDKDCDLWTRNEETFLHRFRFVGRLEETIQIQEHQDVEWLYLQGLSVDVFANLKLEIYPHQLEKGGLYEVRFLSRMRSQPTRAALMSELVLMGWEPLKLSALKKNMRLPRRAGASVTLWYGLATWTGPMSYITDEDPLYFEDVTLVH